MPAKTEKLRIFLMSVIFAGMVIAFFLYILQSRGFFVDENKYDAFIHEAAARHGVDPMLIKAVIFQESVFDSKVVGSAGEVGLMQVLPSGSVEDWAVFYKRKAPAKAFLFDPRLNIEIGTWYLKKGLSRWEKYKYSTELALCQYNAGESRANRWKPEDYSGEVIDRIGIKSTKIYVTRIMNKYRDYKDAQGTL